jgi:hypothetical protein
VRPPSLPSLFRNVRTQPKGFNYTPRYYDERKEDLEKRIRIIEKETELEDRDAEIAKARMKHKMRTKINDRSVHYSDKTRTIRLIIILGVILAIGYVLYSYLDL